MLIEYVLTGKQKEVKPAVAKALIKVKAAREVTGGYLTRDMADQPKIIKQPEEDLGDGLDLLDKASLHELAKERGLELDGRLGAERVRSILRGEAE